jgi:hypothetical protein
MSEFSVEDHNNKLAYYDRARSFRDRILLWAKENHVSVDVITPEWPEPGSKLRLSQEGSQGWLQVESMAPGKLADPAVHGPGRGMEITSIMDDATHAFIIDKPNELGWLLLRRHDYGLRFDDVRRGFPVVEPFDVIEPLLVQVFQHELKKAAVPGGVRK